MKGYRFMSLETAERIASEISRMGWNSRLEFAMAGEPSMHPEIETLIAMFREYLPKNQIMLLSNGAKFLPNPIKKIDALFGAGVDVIAFDQYEGVALVEKILDRMGDLTGVPLYFYPRDKEDREANAHANLGRKKRVIVIADPSRTEKGNHAGLSSHAGAVRNNDWEINPMLQKRCHKVFREMVFYDDGKVNLCCQDFSGSMLIGDIHKDSIDEIWNGPAIQTARRALYHGRDWKGLPACQKCDMAPNRPGLLPDKYGKVSLERPLEDELHDLFPPPTVKLKKAY